MVSAIGQVNELLPGVMMRYTDFKGGGYMWNKKGSKLKTYNNKIGRILTNCQFTIEILQKLSKLTVYPLEIQPNC